MQHRKATPIVLDKRNKTIVGILIDKNDLEIPECLLIQGFEKPLDAIVAVYRTDDQAKQKITPQMQLLRLPTLACASIRRES